MMVRIRHSSKVMEEGQAMSSIAVTGVPFRESAGTLPGIAVLSFPGLLDRARGHQVDQYSPMRPDFHHLVTVSEGALGVSVDFTEYQLTQGDWLWVRPLQVMQFRRNLASCQGRIILFRCGFLDEATAAGASIDRAHDRPPVRSASATQAAEVLADVYRRRDELPVQPQVEVVRHLLAAILVLLAHAGNHSFSCTADSAFLRFRDAVERDFACTHRVEDYARTLGYSVRTLTRACQTAIGHGAKQLIDDRVVLEAKRLLVHTDLTSAAIGTRVGLSSPTAFTKFFRARTGETPTAFRDRAHGAAHL